MPKHIEMIGSKYDRLTVIESKGLNKCNQKLWLCKCDCGGEIITITSKLRSGNTRSCGCYRSENFIKIHYKHGRGGWNKTPEYVTWMSMINRCKSSTEAMKKRYFDRGIKVCDRWKNSFDDFLEDMGVKPNSSLTIDRVNNNEGYCKENCQWRTTKEQSRNKENNRWIEFDNRKMIMSDWAKELNVKNVYLIGYHIKKGKPFEWIYNHFINKNNI